MDQSPVPPRTPLRSWFSSYQSDYETAAEDSDGSFYYSFLGDEEKENDSDDEGSSATPRNSLSGRQTLLTRCLQNSFNHAPRNEYNKRNSFNVNSYSTSTPTDSPTVVFREGTELDGLENGYTKRLKNHELSNQSISPSATEMFESLNRSTIDHGIVSDGNEGNSNSTITPESTDTVETVSEAPEETKQEVIEEAHGATTVTSTTTAFILKTTSIPRASKRFGTASKNPNISSKFGLSNLPIPKRLSIANLANSTATTNVPSQLRDQRNENYSFSNLSGKSGIPRVSLMLARNNSVVHTSSSSTQLKCEYCDKTFAKQCILDGHMLEKCEKIPPARHRALPKQHQPCLH